MKIRCTGILILLLLIQCFCCPALGENAVAELTPGEQWSWTRGAYNTFSGRIDLTGVESDNLSLTVYADLPYENDAEQKNLPVFTSVNGKRIVMTKQSNSIQIVPDEEDRTVEFTVSFRLPEKKRVRSVPLTFRVTDGEGTELKAISGRIENAEAGSSGSGNPFYIPVDIGTVSVILASAAAATWIFVLIRYIRNRNKQRTGE